MAEENRQLARIGLLVPSVNVVVEDDARRYLPGVAVHVGRISLGHATRAELLAMIDDLPASAALLADAPIDAFGFACTAGSMLGEPGRDAEIQAVAEANAGMPATTTTTALRLAFAALGVRRLTFCSPYPAWLHDEEQRALTAAGFTIESSRCLGLEGGRPSAEVTPADVVRLVRETDTDRSEAVLLSCANLRSTEVVAQLEATLGKPVVTSNLALFWHLLHLAGDRGQRTVLGLPGMLSRATVPAASAVGRE